MSDPAILSAPWTPDRTNDTDFMRGVAQMGFQADMGDFAGMAMRHAFERTTAGIIAEDTRIREAEEAAGTANEDWWVGGMVGMPSVNPKAMTPEEFKAQGFDRKGKIQWTSDMTPQRAQILAETYDRRQIEAELLQRDGQGAFRTAVGFGAALLANMPDPVNLIPFGGAAARGASLGRRAFLAAREGAVSTLAADAILMPEAVRRGDDVDFGDLALDVTFGALLGGGLGAAGGLLHNRRVAALEGERAALQSVLTDAGMDSYAAGRSAEQAISVMADMPHSREASRLVRGSLAGLDRMSAGRLLDRTMIAMRDGEDLDVGRWVEELQLGPAMQRARNNQIRALLDSGNYSSVTFGTMSPERTTELNALLTERGAPLDGDELVVSASVGRALFDSGLLRADADADDVARLLSEALTIDRARAIDIPKDRRTRSLFELRQTLEDTGLGDGKPFDLRAARVARRQAAIAIVKRAQVEQFITDVQAQGYSFTDALEALLVGSNERFSGSRESVSRKRGAIKALWSGSLAKELDATGMVPLLNKDRTFGEGVMREMIEPGSTGNKDMRTCADIFSRYLEEFRQRLNEVGADIGKLDNYAPQSHDEAKILKAGLQQWHDAIIGKIDWERTLPDSTPEQRSAFLSNVYMGITTGIPSKSEERPSGPLRPRNLANSLAKERVLHFRDAESAVAYHKEFGQGTIVTAVLNRLQGSANKLALMQTFGPNPEAMLTSLIDGEAQRLKHALADKDAKKVADLWTMRGDGKVANWYKALSGEMGTPGNLTAARIFACARGIISMAKLGGAVLSSFADIPVKAMALRHNG